MRPAWRAGWDDVCQKTCASCAALLFEPNNPATWQRFTNMVNPILEKIRQDQGIERRFRVTVPGFAGVASFVRGTDLLFIVQSLLLEIDGREVHRCYSMSSSPSRPHLVVHPLQVRRQPGARRHHP